MNIGFEAKRFFTNSTGLGNYSRFVVRALLNNFPDNYYYLFTPRHVNHSDSISMVNNRLINVIEPTDRYKFFRATSLWRTWGMSREVIMENMDVFHGLSQELPINLPKSLRKIVTVHDLI